MNQVICLVQARMGSSRLPGKVLAPLAEKPVLQHVIQRCAAAETVERIVIATSVDHTSDPIELWADSYAKASPKPLAVFRGDERDCLARFAGAALVYPAHIYIRATADNPLVDPDLIDGMVSKLQGSDADYCGVERRIALGIGVEAFTAKTLHACQAMPLANFERESITYAMYSRPELFKATTIPAPEELKRSHYRLTLDTEEDYQLFQRIFERFDGNAASIKTADVLQWLDRHPEIAEINKHIRQKPAEEIDW